VVSGVIRGVSDVIFGRDRQRHRSTIRSASPP
jgi:hypothetical protein